VHPDPWLQPSYCPRCGCSEFEWRVPRRDDKRRQCCAGCGFVHYVGPVLAAGVILHDGGKLCLVKRAHEPGLGKWTFPGGFVDIDEDPAAAALREVAEETGYQGEIEQLLGAYKSRGPRDRRVVILVYVGRLTGSPTEGSKQLEEVEELRWFTHDEVPWEEFAFESSVKALRRYLSSDPSE